MKEKLEGTSLHRHNKSFQFERQRPTDRHRNILCYILPLKCMKDYTTPFSPTTTNDQKLCFFTFQSATENQVEPIIMNISFHL